MYAALPPKHLKEKPDWVFSFRWAVATCLGGSLSWTLCYSLSTLDITLPRPPPATYIPGFSGFGTLGCLICLFPLTFGFLIGLAQILVLRKRPRWTRALSIGWFVTNSLSYPLVFIPSLAVISKGQSLSLAFLGVVFAGLLLSWAQWLSLRYYVRGIGIWMLANIGGTVLGVAVAAFTGDTFYAAHIVAAHIVSSSIMFPDWGQAIASVTVVAVGLFVYGLITGIALSTLEAQSASK